MADASTPSDRPAVPQRRGARAFFSGTLVAQGCALGRYMVLARLLGPEQLGLAVTLILTSQFFESVTESGSDRFLIQDRDGDAPAVQRLVHLLAIARGVTIALALVVFAGPVSRFYHQPVLAGGLVALALAPLILGFLHFDLRRSQRHHDFSREARVMLVGESVSLIVTTIAAFVTRDFTAAIWGLVARSIAMVVASHLVAERRWAAGWAGEHARRLGTFALPLTANGLLLFMAAQGDRLLIGNRLGVTELGHYSAVMLLLYYPAQTISRYIQAMNLPLIAAGREQPGGVARAADNLAGEATILSVGIVIGFALVAPIAVPQLYGAGFHQPALVIALIGVLQASRFIRLWPTTVALGIGRSGIVLTNNLVRIVAFPAAIAGLMAIGGIVGLILGFVTGELLAMIVAVMMVNRGLGRSAATDGGRVAVFLAAAAAVLATAAAVDAGRTGLALALGGVALAVAGVAGWRERATIGRGLGMIRRRPKMPEGKAA